MPPGAAPVKHKPRCWKSWLVRLGDSAKILKVDIDKNPQAANQYQVRSVPTLMVFKQGKMLWRQSGVVPANQLQKIIQQFA